MRKLLLLIVLISASITLSAQSVHYITTQQFKDSVFDYVNNKEWKYQGSTPCVIDFYTTWCGPCKRLAPIMEELAATYAGKVKFYKVDTEQERELAYYFQISSIPQMLFVPMSGRPSKIVGLQPKENLEQIIEEVLLK